MQKSSVIATASRVIAGLLLLTLAGALPWLSQRDPAASILRARYAELEPTPEALDSIRTELSLDGGPLATSLRWWADIFHGDLGNSWISGGSIGPGVFSALFVSLSLAGFALLVAAVITALLLWPSCRRVLQDKPPRGSGPLGVALTAMPEFLLASTLLVVVAVQLRWLPPYGWSSLQDAILPALALGIPAGGLLGRLFADAVSSAGEERWVKVWRMAGASKITILRGVLRRAIAAVVDQVGLVLIGILGGAVAVEQVFAIPGLGRYLLGAANSQDLPALQAGILLVAATAILVGLAVGAVRMWLWGGPLPAGALTSPPEFVSRDKSALWTMRISLGLLLLMIVAGLFRDPYKLAHERLSAPSWALPFGADASGRDLLARVAHGALGTLAPAIIIVAVSVLLGIFVALTNNAAVGFIEIANATPPIIAGVVVAALAGPTAGGAALAVLWVSWPPLAAHCRSLISEARALPHVRWLQVTNVGPWAVTWKYVIPVVLPPLLRHGMLRLPGIALSLAALGFLGLGAQPPTPEWGLLLSEGIDYVERAPWTTAAPALALILVSIAAVSAAGIKWTSGRKGDLKQL